MFYVGLQVGLQQFINEPIPKKTFTSKTIVSSVTSFQSASRLRTELCASEALVVTPLALIGVIVICLLPPSLASCTLDSGGLLHRITYTRYCKKLMSEKLMK